MKKIFGIILIMVVMGITAVACKKDKQIVLKLGHVATPDNPYGQGAEYLAQLIEKKSNGEIKVKVFPSSKLGGQKQLIQGLIYGTVDMALTGTAILGLFQPQLALFDLPFIFENREHAYKGLDTVGMELGKPLESKGIKLLGFMENGVKHITNNVTEIKTPADMKNLKIRVMDNKVYIEMIKSLGAKPKPMPFAKVYSELSKGAVDGQENPSAHIFTKKYYKVQKYASLTGHAYAPEPLVISMKRWKRLSGKHKDIILKAVKEAIKWHRVLAKKKDKEFWDKIKATGKMKITVVDREPFKKATRPVYKKMEKIVGAKNIERIKDLAEE